MAGEIGLTFAFSVLEIGTKANRLIQSLCCVFHIKNAECWNEDGTWVSQMSHNPRQHVWTGRGGVREWGCGACFGNTWEIDAWRVGAQTRVNRLNDVTVIVQEAHLLFLDEHTNI